MLDLVVSLLSRPASLYRCCHIGGLEVGSTYLTNVLAITILLAQNLSRCNCRSSGLLSMSGILKSTGRC